MRILFRCDGSKKIGMGHIFRCLALAKKLKKQFSCKILFVVRNFKDSVNIIENNNFDIKKISSLSTAQSFFQTSKIIDSFKPNIVILDMMDLSYQQILLLKRQNNLLVSIDNLENGRNACDIVIVPILLGLESKIYKENSTVYFTGAKYQILRDEFKKIHRQRKIIRKNANKIFVSLGGSDPNNFTISVVRALLNLPQNFKISVVIGPANKNFLNIKKIIDERFSLIQNANDLSKLMFFADIAIISGGITMCECACCGVPSLFISQAEHQDKLGKYFDCAGILKYIGRWSEISEEKILSETQNLISDFTLRKNISKTAKKYFDGKGTERIVKIIKIIYENKNYKC